MKNETDNLKDNKSKGKIKHWKVISLYLILYDVLAINFSYILALLLRFDFKFLTIPEYYIDAYTDFAPFNTVFCIVVFYFMRLYSSLWRFASFDELNRIIISNVITALFHTIGITLFVLRMPISYYLFGAVAQFCFITMVRFGYRYITMERVRWAHSVRATHNVMVIGAGDAGRSILKELKDAKQLSAKPCCVIDDNANKWGRFIEGVQVVGGRDSILESVKKYNIDQIMFAIPSASPVDKRDILNICKETQCELRSLPGIYQLAKGEVSLSKMKVVAVEDLLGREPVKVNLEDIYEEIQGKTILVTGGGGSIGSELCRQIATHNPKQLIVFDIYENNAYDIEQELKRKYGDSLNLVVLIGSVRDSRRINMVFEKYKPQIVYHAAAHKHVPLMETSPNEAIKNNVVGTYKTAYAALMNNVESFILISTDKAVNPTNIMGASKRICEMIIQSMDVISRDNRLELLPVVHSHVEDSSNIDDLNGMKIKRLERKSVEKTVGKCSEDESLTTRFVVVRFGNVLGSNGSVIPLFKKQIEAGGPVTVTHPDIVRYFMTIPEAVSLVMQAGVNASGGEIFVLDMGEQVKIDTLARNLIKLSGLTPDVDIEIEYSGLRPGEKLYEERLMAEEGIKSTENGKIHIGSPIPFEVEEFMNQLEKLVKAAYENSENIVEMVKAIVPTFTPVGDNRSLNNSERHK